MFVEIGLRWNNTSEKIWKRNTWVSYFKVRDFRYLKAFFYLKLEFFASDHWLHFISVKSLRPLWNLKVFFRHLGQMKFATGSWWCSGFFAPEHLLHLEWPSNLWANVSLCSPRHHSSRDVMMMTMMMMMIMMVVVIMMMMSMQTMMVMQMMLGTSVWAMKGQFTCVL